MKKDEQTISSMFDRIADRYDFLNGVLSFGQDARWRKHLIKEIPEIENGALLDIATGTGVVLKQAIQKHPRYERFVGIDISDGMLQKARERLGNSAELLNMSAMKLDFEDDSFDCITFAFGLRNVPDPIHVLQECARVLRPGGRLLLLDFFNNKPAYKFSPVQWYNRHILPIIGGIFSDKKAYEYLPKSVDSFLSTKEVCEQSAPKLRCTRQKDYIGGVCSQLTFTKT